MIQQYDSLYERLNAQNDTVLKGQMKVRIGDFRKFHFKGYILPEQMKKQIIAEFNTQQKKRGTYLIEYLIAEKNTEVTFCAIRFIKEPGLFDPRWIVFPAMFLLHLY